jgi:Ion channel
MCVATLFSFWISPDLVRFEALGLGCLFAVGITLIHISGLSGIVGWSRGKCTKLQERRVRPVVASWYFGATILLMLILHILDTAIWGGIVYAMRLVPNIHDALYFSANTYTSLGYGDVPLSYNWRELSPLMAMSGLFTFACTTGQLFSVMGYHQQILAELRAKHDTKRAASRTRSEPGIA